MFMRNHTFLKFVLIIVIIYLVIFLYNKYKDDNYNKIKFNEKITVSDTIDFTIISNRVTDVIVPMKANVGYSSYNVKSNSEYIEVVANITNISNDKLKVIDKLKSKMLVNNEEYDVIIDVESLSGKEFNSNIELEKDQSQLCHFVIELDDSVLKVGTKLNLIIAIEEEEYKYNMKFMKDSENVMANGSSINLSYMGKDIRNDLINIPDLCTFTVRDYKFTKKVVPSIEVGSYRYFLAGEGKVYFDLRVNVTNTSKNKVLQNEMLGYITLVYKNNSEYTLSKIVEENSGTNLNNQTDSNYISPDELLTYHIICEVPEDVAKSDNSLYVNFFINGENYIYKIR